MKKQTHKNKIQERKQENKKKILFLSPLPPPEYGSAMSSEMCLNILRNSKGFQVENIKLNYSKEMSDVGKINLDKIKGILKVKKQIKEKLRSFRPEKIYFVPATSGLGLIRDYLFVREIKKQIGKGKILFHIRSRTIRNKKNDFFYKKMFSGEKAIVLGEQLIKDVSPWIKKRDISILPNAIKNEISKKEFQKIIEQRKKNKNFNILFLSNMDKTKGWPKLLKTCKILNEKNIDFKCNFVGAWQSEKDEKYFYDFIKKNNLEKKIFSLGKKTGKEKNKFLEGADVLVFPTEYKLETFGRVIIEAMMFGLPVIANGIASIPNIIKQNKTGFILNENTPEEIANYIKKLYNNKKLREDMGKQGRKKFLEEFEKKYYEINFLNFIHST
ncbi:MAG: glycosyltransferase family 4 protein [Nanoarchaeota archaeon]